MRNKDQFRGCLVGGAVGDALGYAVEFLDEQEIFDRYGKTESLPIRFVTAWRKFPTTRR